MTMGNSDDENGEICLTENRHIIGEEIEYYLFRMLHMLKY